MWNKIGIYPCQAIRPGDRVTISNSNHGGIDEDATYIVTDIYDDTSYGCDIMKIAIGFRNGDMRSPQKFDGICINCRYGEGAFMEYYGTAWKKYVKEYRKEKL